jgi:peptide/nickel transport system permease protein
VRRRLPALRRLLQDRSGRIGAVVLVALVLACVLGATLSPYDPNAVDFAQSREGPSLAHPLGTDQFGRDVATRLATGGTVSLAIAAAALAIILAVGLTYGTASALAGHRLDALLMRVVDGLIALPRLPVSIVILVVLGFRAATVWAVVLALAAVNWMLTARLVRGQVLSIRGRDYVKAARVIGSTRLGLARRHVVPNALGVVAVAVVLELPSVILGEAFLSVLGFGPSPPTATWGNIALEGMRFSNVWLVFLPSLAIATLAIAANLLADGLQAALDPRRETAPRGQSA